MVAHTTMRSRAADAPVVAWYTRTGAVSLASVPVTAELAVTMSTPAALAMSSAEALHTPEAASQPKPSRREPSLCTGETRMVARSALPSLEGSWLKCSTLWVWRDESRVCVTVAAPTPLLRLASLQDVCAAKGQCVVSKLAASEDVGGTCMWGVL